MLLIDILNGLSFAGFDFESAIAAARRRTRYLTPVLRKVLEYAAQYPQAYQCRFSESLLASAAFLLSETKDSAFLKLIAPLIDDDAEPWLLGHLPEDPARLIAGGLGARFEELLVMVKDEEYSDRFYTSAFEALVLTAHWDPPLGLKVISVLRSFLGADCLSGFEPDVRVILVECCCRLDPDDFLLDLQLAIDRGDLDEAVTTDLVKEARQRSGGTIWFGDWTSTSRLAVEDMFLQQYRKIFVEKELCLLEDKTPPEPNALMLFNSIAAPLRGYTDLRPIAAERLGARVGSHGRRRILRG